MLGLLPVASSTQKRHKEYQSNFHVFTWIKLIRLPRENTILWLRVGNPSDGGQSCKVRRCSGTCRWSDVPGELCTSE